MNEGFRRIVPALLISACLLPFLPGLAGPFLHDDAANLGTLQVGPFSVQSALDVALRNESGLLRRPLSNLSLAANIWIGGRDEPFGFKLFNLLLHGACGLALFGFARALLQGLWPQTSEQRRTAIALLGAMLWVVHPIQVSTALYVVQRMAQWPTLFLILLAWRFQSWLNRGNFDARSNLSMLLAWGLLSLLALASKENGALAPLLTGVLLLLHRSSSNHLPPPRRIAFLLVGLPIVAGAVVAASHPDVIIGGYANREFTPEQRLLSEAVVLWHYVRLWLLPWIPWMGLYTDIPVFQTSSTWAWIASAGWALLAMAAVLLKRRSPLTAFAVLWFLASHAMESSILPLELVYEHRNYLAFPGIAVACAAGIDWLARTLGVRLSILATLLVMPLAGATLHRAHTWSSPDLFALTEYAHHPTSNRAAMALLAREVAVGNAAGAARLLAELKFRNRQESWPIALDAALQCSAPRYPVDWRALANIVRQQGTDNRTMQLLRQVTINRVRGDCPYLEANEFEKIMALGFHRALAENKRKQAEIYGTYLAWMADSSGEHQDAAKWFWRTATAAPTSVEPLFDLAFMELNYGHTDEANDALVALKARQPFNPTIGYRIHDLESQVKQAQTEQAKAPRNANAQH